MADRFKELCNELEIETVAMMEFDYDGLLLFVRFRGCRCDVLKRGALLLQRGTEQSFNLKGVGV